MITSLNLAYLLVGAFSVVLILISNIIRDKLYLNEALLAVVFGIIIGPHCLNLVNVDMWGIEEVKVTTQVTRIVIAIQVMITGAIILPEKFIFNNYRSMLIMLIPVMLGMWFISGSLVFLMVPHINYIQSLMIASCFTPTDPVLSSSIVQGYFAEKNVRKEIRDLLAAESAANDGLGYPFLFIAIYWIQTSVGEAFHDWAIHILLQQIVLSIALGLIIGWSARFLIMWCFKKNLTTDEPLHLYPLMIVFFLMGLLSWIKSDDLLACFMAGCALSWDEWYQDETACRGSFLQVIDLLLNIGVFAYIGVTMPFPKFVELSLWRLVVLALLVLLFRRTPVVLSVYKVTPLIDNWREAIFSGWFGPIGVGAIFYYSEAVENIGSNTTSDGEPITDTLMAVVYFVVLSSVIVHGLSIPAFVSCQYIYHRFILGTPASLTDLEKTAGVKSAISFTRTTTGTSEATTAVEITFNKDVTINDIILKEPPTSAARKSAT